jgi:hypothetical protein
MAILLMTHGQSGNKMAEKDFVCLFLYPGVSRCF